MSKYKLKTNQIVSVIEKVIVIVSIYNFWKNLQLVIVIVIVTIFAKVICNCNAYILNLITTLVVLM